MSQATVETIAPGYLAGRRIFEYARLHPDHPALLIGGDKWSYGELVEAAAKIADAFPPVIEGEPQPVTAVMAQRHVSSYAAVLAARLAGHAYVPLNVHHPARRSAQILLRSGAQRVICGDRARDVLTDIIDSAGAQAAELPIIDCADDKAGYGLSGNRSFASLSAEAPQSQDNYAYILFTSGSTGQPKGVGIRNAELESYVAVAGSFIGAQPEDCFSQNADLTFDFSVHDLWVCWEHGATLAVPSDEDLRVPAAYVRDRGVTCWASVPSLAYQMRLQGELRPGAFPDLRFSFFCGEALPTVLAREWAAAAPNSRVENWYGPTEATVACTRYTLGDSAQEAGFDMVPIGKAFPGMELLVLDDKLQPCAPGVPGELFLAGDQVAPGYFNDPERTQASFLNLPEDGKRVYRTGDRGVYEADGIARFLGRVDNQAKVRGYRIELGEIEGVLRKLSGGKNSVALAWPADAEIATSVIAALECDTADSAVILDQASETLPDYMVPSVLVCLPEFPKNSSGKVDRLALAGQLAALADSVDDEDLDLPEDARTLLRSIHTHAPLLDRESVMTAKNLFDAGMDSLSFINVTTDIEREFGLSLNQENVVLLAELSFDEILREVRGETHKLSSIDADAERLSLLDRIKKALGLPRIIHKPRANRALQFIERFPAFLAEHGATDVIIVGSSCVFRAFYPPAFTQAAMKHGANVTALNAGFPAVNISGQTMLWEFVRDQCLAAGVRFPLVVYEFDVMLASTRPPSGDIDLGPDYFSGNVISLRGKRTSPEFQWLPETAGAWNAPDEDRQKARKPKWARARDEEIARAYFGEIDFDPVAIADWLRGGRALLEVADRLVVFVHPADREMLEELERSGGPDRLAEVLDDAVGRLGVEVLPWQEFDLAPECYLDINHMNARGGREELSRQLANMLFAK
ncbi:MAG: amino acid adenylation domain-containing protein [Woeseiaceae bacterium]|nr:amino acid adenylation domain-containing protein [Woeseiaceae bacterium]